MNNQTPKRTSAKHLRALPGGKAEGDHHDHPSAPGFAKALAPLALLATVTLITHPYSSGNTIPSSPSTLPKGPTYTQDQLGKMPSVTEQIPHGGGALDAVRDADPGIVAQGDTVTTSELEKFVNRQAPPGPDPNNPILQIGQKVQVPVLPGQTPITSVPPGEG